MLLDRHRVAVVLDLSRIVGSSEAERVASQATLEALLVALYTAATPAARDRFTQAMAQLPATDRPWGALRRAPTGLIALGPTLPPVAHLVLGQRDDDPDALEDGNRLPDRDSKAGEPWRPLYAALDRWDLPTIQQHLGPMGWDVPFTRPTPLDEGLIPEFAPATPVFRQMTASATPPPSTVPSVPPAPSTSPAPSTHAVSNSPGLSSVARPLAVGLGAAALGGALVFVLTRTPKVLP